jgi:hypothetical protein
MASLADAPNLVGFFSYSRADDEGSKGKLSRLREFIQEELRAPTRSDKGRFQVMAGSSCDRAWRAVGKQN